MPVFLQFRLWLQEGSLRERVLAAGAVCLAVTLLVLASLPLRDDEPSSTAAIAGAAAPANGPGGAVAGSAPAAGAGALPVTSSDAAPATGGGTPAPVPQGDGGATAEATEDACAGRAASAPGVTANEVVVGAAIVDLAGPVGNAAFSIRPDMHRAVDAVVADINSKGGVACGRKLVVKKYDVNPIDTSNQQARCLQMVQDKVFSVIDIAGYARPVGRACFVQNKLPHQISTSSTTADLEKGYPYLYGENTSSEKMVRDGILGLHEVGFFEAPRFRKLGLLLDECDPSVEVEIDQNLRKIGVDLGQVSRYTMTCQLVGPPNEVLQGVVQHKSAGVTHVFLASSMSNSNRYTSLAAQQSYRPTYGMSDYGSLTSAAGTWDRSAVGSIAVTSTRRAELNSGIRNAEVSACDRILRANGLKGVVSEKDDGVAQHICDSFWFWKKAIDRAGVNPTRLSLIETGLASIGRHTSGGNSDGNFDRKGKVVGGDFYRPLQLDEGCLCWKVRDPKFTPGH